MRSFLLLILLCGCSTKYDCTKADREAMRKYVDWCSPKEVGVPSNCISHALRLYCEEVE